MPSGQIINIPNLHLFSAVPGLLKHYKFVLKCFRVGQDNKCSPGRVILSTLTWTS